MMRAICTVLCLFTLGFGLQEDFCMNRETFCTSGYCKCHNPYATVLCTCKPNGHLQQIQSLTLNESGGCEIPNGTRNLTITDCSNVTVAANTFFKSNSLTYLQLENIKELNIESNAFSFNSAINNRGLRIELRNITIPDLPRSTFAGSIQQIYFHHVYLGLIRPFAFANLNETDLIQFNHCNIANIQPQAFKKFETRKLFYDNSQFNKIPGRFVNDVYVSGEFRIFRCLISVAETSAFRIHGVEMTNLIENQMNVVQAEAWSVNTRGSVKVAGNKFEEINSGAFFGFHVDQKALYSGRKDFLFDNNTIPSSLTKEMLKFNTTSYHVKLGRINIEEECTCGAFPQWHSLLYPEKEQKITFESLRDVFCLIDMSKEVNNNFTSSYEFYQQYCSFESSILSFIIIVVLTSFLLCIAITIVIVVLKKRAKWLVVPTTDAKEAQLQKINPNLVMPAKGVVIPDGRTYRETEFHVVEEKVVPMDDVIPCKLTKEYLQQQAKTGARRGSVL